MELAARRPHISAGIALASAAVIAAAPMAQHLPQLDAAHYLPQVSVTDINLTDAASPMMDLFAGVENDLASLASGASAAAVPASVASAAFDPTQNLIVQTWINAFETAGANLQTIYNTWSQTPFPVLQQVAANGISYADLYVSTWQTAANAGVKYFFGSSPSSFGPMLARAWSDYLAGKISTAMTTAFTALYTQPLVSIGLPLEKILQIPVQFTQNIANATSYLMNGAVPLLGTFVVFGPSQALVTPVGNSLQAAYNAWNAGDAFGAVTNLFNTPGVAINGFLNGSARGADGLLSNIGALNYSLNIILPSLAQSIVAPDATNIVNGGSLASTFQAFSNQLINGWPNLTPVISGIGNQLTGMLQSIPSVLSNLPSMLSNAAGVVASNIGLLIANLLKLL